MADVIWKFPLTGFRGSNSFFAEMAIDATPLSAGYQDGNFVVWAMVDSGAKKERRYFHIAGTGHRIPGGLQVGGRFLNRIEVSAPSGLLIFHAFDTLGWDTLHG